MTLHRIAWLFAVCAATPLVDISAQQAQAPAVRPLGLITHVTHDTLRSVARAVPVAGGGVYVNDIVARRLVLYDSTLANPLVIADSSGDSGNPYGNRPGTLVAYRGDSALFLSPEALSMLVLTPSGDVARVMAMPPSGRGMPGLVGVFGTPGFDGKGRMVFFTPAMPAMPFGPSPGNAPTIMQQPDSAFVVRFDFTSRRQDTVATLRIPSGRQSIMRDDQNRFRNTIYALPPRMSDEWAVASDGSIAVVRGRDYHVDWLSSDGTWGATPRVAFDWEQLNDEAKVALLDSVTSAMTIQFDSMMARQRQMADSMRRAGGRGPDPNQMPNMTVARGELTDVPDYRPPFNRGSVQADADGNLWVRTNKFVDKRPVYDIINRAGQLTDRVQLPPSRTIAGFGPGVIYMGVRDSTGVTHVERARIK